MCRADRHHLRCDGQGHSRRTFSPGTLWSRGSASTGTSRARQDGAEGQLRALLLQPRPGLAGDANPNQALKTITYNWNDADGDRHFQIGEQTSLSSTALEGTITIDPKIKQPHSQEFSAFLDREVTQGFAAHAGFVYKTEDNPPRPTCRAVLRAPTVPFTSVDAGPDGTTGTSDDRVLTSLRRAERQRGYGVPGRQPHHERRHLPPLQDDRGLDQQAAHPPLVDDRRDRLRLVARLHLPEQSESVRFIDRRTTGIGFKASGTYEAPTAFASARSSGCSRGPYARTISVAAPASCSCIFTGTVDVEPRDAVDRTTPQSSTSEWRRPSPGSSRRVRLFGDVYNIFNATPPRRSPSPPGHRSRSRRRFRHAPGASIPPSGAGDPARA